MRVCLLTGAGGPLGAALLHDFADRYQFVVIEHESPLYCATQDQQFVDPLDPSAEPVGPPPVHAIRADLTRPAEVTKAVRETLDTFGGIDLLVNGAACRDWAPLLADGALDRAEETFAVNVLAPLRLALEAARLGWRDTTPENLERNRNVVNVSSTAGLFAYPDLGQGIYGTSKAALNHLTYHLASEFWDIGVRVNAIAPDTFPGRVSVRRVLDAIADLDSSDQTGQIVHIGMIPS